MDNISAQLSASIESSRNSFQHNLTKGEAIEASVRDFLRKHLPSSIGITHGQVIDKHGNTSRQLDIILYDARRTPILYADAADELQIIPCEGVLAAIEVKTNLQLGDIPTLANSAFTLKSLDRTSYYFREGPIEHFVNAYGRQWKAFPPMYFIIAFDGPSPQSIAGAIAQASRDTPLSQHIDMVCVINRGIVANSTSARTEINALPYPGSVLFPYETTRDLFLFYLLMTRYLFQADLPPIAMQEYIPNNFLF